jgi:Holliday junction resolvase RusA-like endonuclease
MTADMTTEEKIRALVRVTGMPEQRARTIVANQVNREPAETSAVSLPLSITLPWSHLVSDNDRYGVSGGRMILSKRYKAARAAIKALLRDQLAGQTPIAFPVALHARVFVPDRRTHDVPDFAKGVLDAIQRQIYTNDAWVYDSRWTRAGVDCDRPRAEITISHFSETTNV